MGYARWISDVLAGVEAEEDAVISATGVIEVIGDQGQGLEADMPLGAERRIGAEACQPLLVILLAAKLCMEGAVAIGHSNRKLTLKAQDPDELLSGPVEKAGSSPAPVCGMDHHIKAVEPVAAGLMMAEPAFGEGMPERMMGLCKIKAGAHGCRAADETDRKSVV